MKCEETVLLLEEYLDGELDPHTSAQVLKHVAVCESCSQIHQELDQEREMYSHYQPVVEIPPTLWPAIEKRLNRKPSSRFLPFSDLWDRIKNQVMTPRLSPVQVTVLIVVAVGLTFLLLRSLQHSPKSGPISVEILGTSGSNISLNKNEPEEKGVENSPKGELTPPNESHPPVVSRGREDTRPRVATTKFKAKSLTPAQLISQAEEKYLKAIRLLNRDIRARQTTLDPQTAARFEKVLNDVDRTIAETKRIVRENPNDPVAAQYLMTAYAKKIEVLQEMAGI